MGRLYRGQGGRFTSKGDDSGGSASGSVDGVYFEDGSIARKYLNVLDQIFMGKRVTDQAALATLRAAGLLTKTNRLTTIARALVKAIRAGDKAEAKRLSQLAADEYLKSKASKTAKGSRGTAATAKKAAGEKPPKSPAGVVDQLSKAIAIDKDSFARLSQLAVGKGEFTAKDLQRLVQHGLVTGDEKNGFKLTDLGKAVQKAINASNYDQAFNLIMRYVRQQRRVQEMLEEAATKSIGGRTHEAGDFLVVEDPEKPSTWHLPVKVRGKPDHRLMGAAWAALFSAGGYRGNKYEGPMKDDAKRKLKALYRDEGLEFPSSPSEVDDPGEDAEEGAEGGAAETDVSEYYDGPILYRPYGGAQSFADLLAAQKANEAADEIRRYCYQFPELVMNIVSDPMAEKRPEMIRRLAGEFSDLVEAALDKMASPRANGDAEESEETDGDVMEFTEDFQTNAVNFQEVEAPAEISEAPGSDGADKDKPPRMYAYIDIEAIQPGWGNQKDNNYYPAEVLRRDAHKLVGAKMYETDHRAEEKSTRTWVSTVKELVGFSERGAPIVRAAIHDPGFTQRARNLNELGLLSKLECSIQGQGRAKPGFTQGGRKGNWIAEFIEIPFLDWVTRAGAGGRAAALVESDAEGGAPMQLNGNSNAPTGAAATTPAPKTPAVERPQVAQTSLAATQETQVTQIHENAQTPTLLEKAKVVELLAASALPKAAQDRLAEATYADEAAVQTAIQREIDYVKTLTGSGRPVGMGEAAGPATGNPVDLKEVGKAKAAVNAKYLGPISAR